MDPWQKDNKHQKFTKQEKSAVSAKQTNNKPVKQDPDESLKATFKVFLIMSIITMGLHWLSIIIIIANLNSL